MNLPRSTSIDAAKPPDAVMTTGKPWICGHCLVPNIPEAVTCRSCKNEKVTIEYLNEKHNRQSHIFFHCFLGFIEIVSIAVLIRASVSPLYAIIALIVVWWSGLIFLTLNSPAANAFTHTQKVAERFVAQLSPERRGWALVIYRILYWPILFQKTIALLFGMLVILWLIYSWK